MDRLDSSPTDAGHRHVHRRPRVLIADPDWASGSRAAAALAAAGLEVLRPVHSARDALDAATRTAPDVIVTEVKLDGGGDGINAARAMARRRSTPVVYLTQHADPATVHRAASALAAGYVVKPYSDQQLVCAVLLALHGSGSALQSEGQLRSEPVPPRLSPRETQIAEALVAGSRVTRIAGALGLSTHTVRNHLRSIFRKLEVGSQSELVELWQRQRQRVGEPDRVSTA